MNDRITIFQKIVLVLSIFILIGISYNLSFKDECWNGCPISQEIERVKIVNIEVNKLDCNELEYVYPRCNISDLPCSKVDVLNEMRLKGCG